MKIVCIFGLDISNFEDDYIETCQIAPTASNCDILFEKEHTQQ